MNAPNLAYLNFKSVRHELDLERNIYDGRFKSRLPPVTKEEMEEMEVIRKLLGTEGVGLTLEDMQ